METRKVVSMVLLIAVANGCSSLQPAINSRLPAAEKFAYSCPCILMKESLSEDWAEEASTFPTTIFSEDAEHPSDDEVRSGCNAVASTDVRDLLLRPQQTHRFFWARLNVERTSPISATEYSGTTEKSCIKQ
jgi:hypothetical protein